MGKKNKKKRNKNKADQADVRQQPTPNSGTGGRNGDGRGGGKEDGRRRRSGDEEKDLTNPTVASAAAKSSSGGGETNNPLLVEQRQFLQKKMTSKERECFFDNTNVPPTRRAELWMEQAEIGERLVNNFSWATPNETAFRVLKHFSPLVEVGCGSNAYWIRQLLEWDHNQPQQQLQQQNGGAKPIDVIGFDHDVQEGGKILSSSARKKNKKKKNKKTVMSSSPGKNFIVQRGGPEVLSDPEIVNKNRTLFLCYPDDEDMATEGEDNDGTIQSFGWNCLDHFQGQYVIHVGELIMADNNLSYDQAPWGRSSSPEFQQRLMSEYHCIYKITLPSWVHVRDTLSVWKRTELCTMVFAAGDDEDDDEGGNNGEEEEEEEVHYRHIPPDEILPVDVAALCMAHLLPPVLSTNKGEDVAGLSKTTRKGVKTDQLQNEKHRKRKHSDKEVQSNKHAKLSSSSRQDHHDDEGDDQSDGTSDGPINIIEESGAYASTW
mmetsp:Transcript_30258/g.73635  ORF Transcript_30258/g.73635 Transcript_30258/m.73635 type:complete len:489 (+) Transcript_30258:38-1504(+)